MEYRLMQDGLVYDKFETRQAAEQAAISAIDEIVAERRARRRQLLDELSELDAPIEPFTIQEYAGPDGWYVWDASGGCLSGPHEEKTEAEDYRYFYREETGDDCWVGQVIDGVRDKSYRVQ